MPVNVSHNPPCTKCGSTNVSDITLKGRKAYTRYLCGDCRNTWTVWHGQAHPVEDKGEPPVTGE